MPTPSKRTTSKEIAEALSETETAENEPTKETSKQATSLGGFPIVSAEGMDGWVNMMIYGEPGVGKTVLAGSASDVEAMSPVVVVDVEGGTMPLQSLYPNAKVVRVKSFRDLQKVYDALYKGGHGFKTVVLDSITEIQKMSMASIMKHNKDTGQVTDESTPRIQDWGTNLYQTRAMIRAFRDLPMHTIFVALNDEGEKNGRATNRPLFQGKLKGEGPGFVDIVAFYYLERKRENTRRLLLTTSTETTMAKDRSTRLPKLIESPTMQELHDYITGVKTVSAD